jgi:outer membrane receptor protein involved in Fe transport
MLLLWLFVALLSPPSFAFAQTTTPLAEVQVRGSTPLMGLPVPREHVPANVQVTTGEEFSASGAVNVTDFLSRRLAGVNLTHAQSNPFQPDVSYRGFTGSFLLGTPPGLSVFVDGVRVNEPLADQINWDLIPMEAIDRIELIPGSNPVYGRNTLGGAFVMQTKRGLTHQGTQLEMWGGSFGRNSFAGETGGVHGNVDYFFSGRWFAEDGFRDFSHSRVGQAFGKLGYQKDRSDMTLSLSYVNNRLTGNGPLPESRLSHDRGAVYTHADHFEPELWFLTGEYRRELGAEWELSANAFGRLLDVTQSNVDVDEDVRAFTAQHGWGGAAQLSYRGAFLGWPMTLAAGADYSGAVLNHRIGERDREADARTNEEARSFSIRTHVRTRTDGGGPFLTLTIEPLERLALTVAGRYDVTALRIIDRLAAKIEGETTNASGHHVFTRFNPAIGATYALTHTLNAYVSYSESYRTPTAIELTCADPRAPCPIPTAILNDPPLKAVKGKTWETGLRWSLLPSVRATLVFFRTDLKDDILFRNDPASRVLGFFQNVDATRRQGIELLLQGAWRQLRWYANYTLTDATFEDDIELFTFATADHVEHVRKGDALPLTPPHRFNGGIELALAPAWRLGVDGVYVGAQYLRGDEANAHRKLAPYFVANARLEYQTSNVDVFVRIENLFDSDYETYGAFFENIVAHTGIERFLGPGAPIGAFGGVRIRF